MVIIKQIDSETLILRDLKDLLGKKVKINIEVIDEAEPAVENANSLGKYKLGKELDDIDIRNFAYEEN
jgi:hypothetical protein